jgi:hypothetical protein
MKTPISAFVENAKAQFIFNSFSLRLIIFIFVFLPLLCCKSNSDKIQEQVELAAGDAKISKAEYEDLIDCIKINDPRGFDKLTGSDNQLDNAKVTAYILKISLAKKLKLYSEDIWRPVSPNMEKSNINVFLENSASMNGYVGENSTFKTTIFKLLTDLKNFHSTDSLNLNYINTRSISIKENASRDDIDDFYKRLNPSDFKRSGGSVASTDIERMLKILLDGLTEKSLSVFISDCVFSPGNTDAKKYLDGQYASIYNDFTHSRNSQPNLAIVILQCTSMFEGTYYDYLDLPHSNLEVERPYYIWFIGTSSQIKQLMNNKLFELIKGGYKNKLVFESADNPLEPEYKILQSNKIGNFRLKEGAKGSISDAEFSDHERDKGKFGFNVAVDFSVSLQDSRYFLDSNNYKLSSNYQLTVESIIGNSDVSLKSYSHKLKLQTEALKNENLNIEVIGKVPSWVYSHSSNNDKNIEHDLDEVQKTFGFKYLIEGVADAFYPKSSSNTISTITLEIKK